MDLPSLSATQIGTIAASVLMMLTALARALRRRRTEDMPALDTAMGPTTAALARALIEAGEHALSVGIEALTDDGRVDRDEAEELILGSSRIVAETLMPGELLDDAIVEAITEIYAHAAELRRSPAQLIAALRRARADGKDRRARRLIAKLKKRGADIPEDLRAEPEPPETPRPAWVEVTRPTRATP